MNNTVGEPQIGQWYEQLGKGELFQVTGVDDRAKTIEIQSYNGDIDEIDADTWAALPLVFAELPEGLTAPAEEMEAADDVACLQAESALEDPGVLERLA